MNVRKASHAGCWYISDAKQLSIRLEHSLSVAKKKASNLKAIICPHAGYEYSLSTLCWSYKQILATKLKKIFVLGPSHHVYVHGCHLPETDVSKYATPLGCLQLDLEIISSLRSTKLFEEMNLREDEREHSIEMQLPFIKHVLNTQKNQDATIVPIFVGEMSLKMEIQYADILMEFFKMPDNLFIISSDFCHWGERYNYTYIKPDCTSCSKLEAIEMLDKEAVRYIERHDCNGFATYLSRTRNNICGQNPIKLLLRLIERCKDVKFATEFLHYSQSGAGQHNWDSSVSYVSMMTNIC